MAVTDDKWGLAGLGEAELFLTKEAPCMAPFPHPLQTFPCRDITSCAGSGLGWPARAGAGTLKGASS